MTEIHISTVNSACPQGTTSRIRWGVPSRPALSSRFRAVLFSELGDRIADRGRVRFPAYAPEGRRRPVTVAQRLTAYWGQQVFVEAEDLCRVRLCLAGRETLPEPSEARPR
ncbi:hypothetical protein ACF1A9_31390 [Streptomyces sp. NPDC014872]|uniref:hypothetical protein n=1 Tax=Streptomyces sp. NPDC014872 TaxID=3364926 RepID=UPI0036FAB43E